MKKLFIVLILTIFLLAVTTISVNALRKVDMCVNPNNWHVINVSVNSIKGHEQNGGFVINESNPCPPDNIIEIDNVIPEADITDAQLASCPILFETCERPECDPDPISFSTVVNDVFFERYHRYCMIYFRLENGNGFYALTNFRYGGYEVRGIHTKTAGVVRTLATPEIALVDWYVAVYNFTHFPVIENSP